MRYELFFQFYNEETKAPQVILILRPGLFPGHVSSSMISTNISRKIHFLKVCIYSLHCNKPKKYTQMCFITQATTLEMLYSSLSAIEFIDFMGKMY